MSHLRYSQVKRCTTGKECSVGVGTAQFILPQTSLTQWKCLILIMIRHLGRVFYGLYQPYIFLCKINYKPNKLFYFAKDHIEH